MTSPQKAASHSPDSQRRHWFNSFPGHPTHLPAVISNEVPGLDKREVRWALTLAIDIVQVAWALQGRGNISASTSATYVPMYINSAETG